MNIGRPKRVIEIEPVDLPLPSLEPIPEPAPAQAPERQPSEPAR